MMITGNMISVLYRHYSFLNMIVDMKDNMYQHMDSTFGYNLKTEDRKISFSIQLSDPDDYEGGELLLNHGNDCVVSKTKGSMTLFPSFTVHEVKPVTKGIRYSLVGWVVGDKLK